MIDMRLDEYDMHDEEDDEPRDVTCKRCGETGLYWQRMYVDGHEKPVLFEPSRFTSRRHECKQQPSVAEHFD